MGEPSTKTVIVVIMGGTGSGKTTIGRLLAARLGVPYAEADAFHPPANVAKMAAGHPLDDTDREPWLAAIADWIKANAETGGVVSCSALKIRYRQLLQAADPAVWFLHLEIDRETVTRRVAARTGHFMPASLVESQFQALEPLGPDERGMAVDATAPPATIADTVVARLVAEGNISAR